MSVRAERAVQRALARLAGPEAMLAPDRSGVGFGVFVNGDRRRRPLARLTAAQVKVLASEGAIAALPEKNVFVLTEAGRARSRRVAAPANESYVAQHGNIADRAVIDTEGALYTVRAVDGAVAIKRLSQLRDARGAPWLSPSETAAALRLREDWEAGQVGLARGSDWSAPPRSGSARGGANVHEIAMSAGCDARRRVAEALEGLAPPLRRVVEHVCLREEGLDALERGEGWPARSGKIALKFGLAQLASLQAASAR